jgi:hypothetical protein
MILGRKLIHLKRKGGVFLQQQGSRHSALRSVPDSGWERP